MIVNNDINILNIGSGGTGCGKLSNDIMLDISP